MSWFNLGSDDPDSIYNKRLKKYYADLKKTREQAELIPPDSNEMMAYDEDMHIENICRLEEEGEKRGRKPNNNLIRTHSIGVKKIRVPISPRIRQTIFEMANGICQNCFDHECMELHHKDGDRSNDTFSNLMAVCANCHKQLDSKLRRSK